MKLAYSSTAASSSAIKAGMTANPTSASDLGLSWGSEGMVGSCHTLDDRTRAARSLLSSLPDPQVCTARTFVCTAYLLFDLKNPLQRDARPEWSQPGQASSASCFGVSEPRFGVPEQQQQQQQQRRRMPSVFATTADVPEFASHGGLVKEQKGPSDTHYGVPTAAAQAQVCC